MKDQIHSNCSADASKTWLYKKDTFDHFLTGFPCYQETTTWK